MNSVERVRAICKERKIAISKLEKDLGYGNGYISQLRKGTFPADRLMEICEYLSISPEFVLTGKEKSTPTDTDRRTSDIQLSPLELDLIRKFRRLDDRGRSAVLNTLDHEYALLPGEKSPAPKQA